MGSAWSSVAVAWLSALPQSPPVDDLGHPPPTGGKPVAVTIGFFAMDFARVTSREESFDMTAYLELRWRDPRLIRPGPARRVDPSTTWTPRIFFENALEPPHYHFPPEVEVDSRGEVTSWAILSGKFSSRMNLARFPFDSEVLTVRVGGFADAQQQAFVVDPELAIVGADAFVTDWTIDGSTSRVEALRYVAGQDLYQRLVYEVSVSRRATFYVWRVMLPLTLLTLVAWAAFWFEPVGLQPQISTAMAALIALVAFNFAIDFALPKVAYLTLIDKHALIGFGFVASAIALVTVVHVAVSNNRLALAKRIQRAARWTFLPLYALAVALNVVLTLR